MAAEKKPNPLFDLLNALFTNKEYIYNLSNETMKQYCFMVNRRIAIKYPLQAQVFNNSKVNPSDVIKFWAEFLYTGTRPPGWIYTSGAVKSQAKKEEKSKVTSAMIKSYCNHYQLSIKDVDAALRFYPDDTVSEILEFETIRKQMNSYEENNN